MSEYRGFVFALSFIVLFASILSAVPTGLQGTGATPDNVSPVEASLIADFSESVNFSGKSGDFVYYAPHYDYAYNELGGRNWLISYYPSPIGFVLGAKVTFAGFWFGTLDYVNFINNEGTNRGDNILFTDIESDADEGAVRYDLQYVGNGNSAGAIIFFWNTTAYDSPSNAWGNDSLYIQHGFGISNLATTNIGTLLVQLLLLQLPDIPVLLNLIIITPIWASIIYVLWFVIKSMVPFLG